ncbi:MAG TPA: CpaD family pilus assembly lipoprotein [Sphingomonas sp.]
MAHRIRTVRAATAIMLALAFSAGPASAEKASQADNRGLDTVHYPVVSRTDYVLDVATGPAGLASGEAQRLSGWFEGLGLGYGDTIAVDTSALWHNGAIIDAIGGVAADYGMLISHDAPPATTGHAASGAVRVVVSRAVARVDGCPDWSVGNTPTHNGATPSNFGCATMTNLAAMVANPQDLVEGQHHRPSDAMVSVKAIKAYRDAATTGADNTLKTVSTKSTGAN